MENNSSFNSEENNQNIFFFCSLKLGISRTRKTPKTKITSFSKHVFNLFCFQEHKTVLENNNQTDPIFSQLDFRINGIQKLWIIMIEDYSLIQYYLS